MKFCSHALLFCLISSKVALFFFVTTYSSINLFWQFWILWEVWALQVLDWRHSSTKGWQVFVFSRERCFSSCPERGTKKKILSPHEVSNLRPSDSAPTRRTTSFPISLPSSKLTITLIRIYKHDPKVWGSIPLGDSEFLSLSHARDKTKDIFLYFFTELKTYHLSLFYLYWVLLVKYRSRVLQHPHACQARISRYGYMRSYKWTCSPS